MAQEKEPFANLEINYRGSEYPLQDFRGNRYEDFTVLHGEKAYEFLVQLNQADKVAFEKRRQGRAGYDKTDINLKLGSFAPPEMRFELGFLEFRGAKSIADALSLIEGTEALIPAFRKEEEQYLQKHPEIKAINERSVTGGYTYLADRATFQSCQQLGAVLEELHPQHLAGYVLLDNLEKYDDRWMHSYLSDTQLETIGQIQEALRPLGNQVLFTSERDPHNLAYGLDYEKLPCYHIQPVLTPREAEAIKFLNEQIVLKENYARFIDREDDHATLKWPEHPTVSHGLNAVYRFARLVERDEIKGSINDRHHLDLQLGDKHYETEFTNFPDALLDKLGGEKFLPDLPKKLEDQLRIAWPVMEGYAKPGDPVSIFEKPNRGNIGVSIDYSKKRWEEDFRSIYGDDRRFPSFYDKQRAINYYLQYAAFDIQNDTPEKLIHSAFQHMADDGIDRRKATNLLSHAYNCPKYYDELGKKILKEDKALAQQFKENAHRKVTR